MAENCRISGLVREGREECERHDGVFCKTPFPDEEEGEGEDSENYQAEDQSRVPRSSDATVLKAEEKHEGPAYDCESANPVDSAEAWKNGGAGSFDVEEKEENAKGNSIERLRISMLVEAYA